ncbi:MAG: helix-turn-helix transcriptional regulator [Clostridia bacterium]|nr:helix-turn-helix transcriptional regulator [Clostridia bacterium]
MLNENIKKLRMAQGISQVELAKKLNVSKQCVSNWENDYIQPSVEMLIKLANYFNVTTDYLLDLQTNNQISVEGLSEKEIAHIKFLIQDLRK